MTPVVPVVPSRPLLPVVGADLPLPVLGGGTRRHVHLDLAATAPALRAVADAVTAALPWSGSVHRGAGLPSQVATARYEEARREIGTFVGAREDDVVVVVRNTTDALNLLASAVAARGGEVVVVDVEHHANLLPWRTGAHRLVPAATTVQETIARIAAELALRPAALLAVTGASNVTGEVLPLERLTALAHAHGARIAVDAAQLAPHRRISLAASGVDYVAFSGHKLYAPFGAGALVGRRDWLDAAPPHLAGGGAVVEVRSDGTDWAAAPQRHEGGTPNLVGAVALAAACRTLAALPEGALEAHERALHARLLTGLEALPGVAVHRLFDDADDAIGVVAFTVDGLAPGLVSAVLAAEHAISVRDGRFCAHIALERVLRRPEGAVRASLGACSSLADVEALLAAVERLVTEGPAGEYVRCDDGTWAPARDDRTLPEPLVAGATAGGSPCTAAAVDAAGVLTV
ncbi:aminotransferase class V-fold PLP-dependent enzyme [Paraconexibacter algicola]|uniref:Cysteine desulfurase n=1 Tax=Paraconexibacter algicola TaxID=2133960 RepID=A0A2T4UGJ3_9ACTN|nr:aminotransferase class V-fold PLP-dependent enzyme [Paraconexibacter algicola]PTL58362.1 cysteine desulfurase [Paraconexibacter algicola]